MKIFLSEIYTYAFLDQFILIYPVYAILFRDSGLSPLQVGSLFAIWSGITILFEVPTGVLADKYSRRNILVAAQLLKAIGYGFWLFNGTYLGFAVGFALWGFAGTLVSGTFESFVYDELKHFEMEKQYEKVNGRIVGTRFVSVTLATLLGGFAAEFGYDIALVPSIIIPLVAAGFLFTIKSVRAEKSTGERTYWTVLKEAVKEARTNTYLLQLMSYFALVFGVSRASDEYWGLLFQDMGVTLAMIGIIFAIANSISALAGFTAHLWQLIGKRVYAFVVCGSVVAMLLAYLNVPVAIPLSFLMVYIIQVASTKLEARLQHAISSHQRATITSLNSFVLEAVALSFYTSVGFLAKEYGYISFLWLASSVIGAVSILYLFMQPHRNAV